MQYFYSMRRTITTQSADNLFIGDAYPPTRRADQGRIETEPPPGLRHLGFFDDAINPGKNQLTGCTALAGGGLVDPTVKIAGQVNGNANDIGLHTGIMVD
jgi:hypothetical protein